MYFDIRLWWKYKEFVFCLVIKCVFVLYVYVVSVVIC